jgi:hypothetical protein
MQSIIPKLRTSYFNFNFSYICVGLKHFLLQWGFLAWNSNTLVFFRFLLMLYLGFSFRLFFKTVAPIYLHCSLLLYYISGTGLSNFYNIIIALIDIKCMFSQTTFANYAGSLFVLTVAFYTLPSVSIGHAFYWLTILTHCINCDRHVTNSIVAHLKGPPVRKKYRLSKNMCTYPYWRRKSWWFQNKLTN